MVKRRKVDRRMVVISLDAVGARDLAYLKTLPNFRKLRAQTGYCDQVESVYPSHYVSGAYVDRDREKTAASWCCQQSAAAARQKEPGLDVAEAFYPWEDFI